MDFDKFVYAEATGVAQYDLNIVDCAITLEFTHFEFV